MNSISGSFIERKKRLKLCALGLVVTSIICSVLAVTILVLSNRIANQEPIKVFISPDPEA